MFTLAIGIAIGAVLAVAVPAVGRWASAAFAKGKDAADKLDL